MNKIIGVFFFIFCLSMGLLFINEGLFHYDSIVLAQAVEAFYETGHLQPAVGGRYAAVIINAVLYFPFFLAGQNADLVTRLSSILFYALSIMVLFFFTLELFQHRAQAFFTALLYSVVGLYFLPNTYGKEHGMAMFFLLLALLYVLKGRNTGRSSYVWGAGCSYAMSIAAREPMLILFPLYVLFFIHPRIAIFPFRITIDRHRIRKDLPALLSPVLLMTTVLLLSPGLVLVAYQALSPGYKTVASFTGFLSEILLTGALPDLFKETGWFLVICAVVGWARMFRRVDIFLPAFFLIWFSMIFIYGNSSTYTPRHLDVVVLAMYLVAMYAVAWVYDRSRVVAVATVVCLFLGQLVYIYPMLDLRHRYNATKRFCEEIAAVTPSNALVVVADDWPFIQYYAHREPVWFPTYNQVQLKERVEQITAYIKRGLPVYMINSAYGYDVDGSAGQAIHENFNVQKVLEFFAEDYHRAERLFYFYPGELYRLSLKEPVAEESSNAVVENELKDDEDNKKDPAQ